MPPTRSSTSSANLELRAGAVQPAWGNDHYKYIKSLIKKDMEQTITWKYTANSLDIRVKSMCFYLVKGFVISKGEQCRVLRLTKWSDKGWLDCDDMCVEKYAQVTQLNHYQ